MYLTKIELNPRDRGIQGALSDCQKMHRMVGKLFDCTRKEADCLYRLQTGRGTVSLYLYAQVPIRREKLLPSMEFRGERELSDWLDRMEAGQSFRFDLLAMPACKHPVPGRKNSRRELIRTPEKRMEWLERKGWQNGFRLLEGQEEESIRLFGRHRAERGGEMFWAVYHYNGLLQITDAERFRCGLQTGIGPGRAYGLGMLLLK